MRIAMAVVCSHPEDEWKAPIIPETKQYFVKEGVVSNSISIQRKRCSSSLIQGDESSEGPSKLPQNCDREILKQSRI